ncbi:hypothetical protein ACTD5D_25720 [Nocardia takedensis]|uniref:hypothetical protein n=1 Tax=Nocardia takedensis TaxID=259390 RepID=UPI003F76C9D5
MFEQQRHRVVRVGRCRERQTGAGPRHLFEHSLSVVPPGALEGSGADLAEGGEESADIVAGGADAMCGTAEPRSGVIDGQAGGFALQSA